MSSTASEQLKAVEAQHREHRQAHDVHTSVMRSCGLCMLGLQVMHTLSSDESGAYSGLGIVGDMACRKRQVKCRKHANMQANIL